MFYKINIDVHVLQNKYRCSKEESKFDVIAANPQDLDAAATSAIFFETKWLSANRISMKIVQLLKVFV